MSFRMIKLLLISTKTSLNLKFSIFLRLKENPFNIGLGGQAVDLISEDNQTDSWEKTFSHSQANSSGSPTALFLKENKYPFGVPVGPLLSSLRIGNNFISLG